MSNYVVLARKWRPQQFDDVAGQRHVARTLTNAITAGRIAQAYLFSGPRGVGKTTMARILAKALNCQATAGLTPTPCQECEPCREITQGISIDVMEIDGASNRGINEIRELRENIRYAPVKGRRRVYIIDEVHMLTNEAFNALLKTLEEPPPHVLFVFATTEIHKVPATIQSRCQQFVFRRLSRREIAERVTAIAQSEQFTFSSTGIGMIAQAADGSLRDALSLLDQAVAYGGPSISEEELRQLLGVIDRGQMAPLFEALARRDAPAGLRAVRQVVEQGQDLRQFCGMILEWLRHLTVAKLCTTSGAKGDAPAEILDLSEEDRLTVEQLSSRFEPEELQRLFLLWGRVVEELRGSLDPVFTVEMGVVRSTQLPALESFAVLLEKAAALERRLGVTPDTPTQPVSSPVAPGGQPRVAVEETRVPPQSTVHAPSGPASEPIATPSTGTDEQAEWRTLVHAIKQQKPNLATYLEGGQLLEVTERELVLGYPERSAFMAEMMKKAANQEFLAAAAAQQFRRSLRVKIVVTKGTGAELSGAAAAGAVTMGAGSPSTELPLEPLIHTVLDLFDGSVVVPPLPVLPPSAGTSARPPAPRSPQSLPKGSS